MEMQLISLPVKGLFTGLREITGGIPADGLHRREQQQLRQVRHNRRRAEIITSRILLKDLADMAGLGRKNFHIVKDGRGRPVGVKEGENISVGISHSERHVLCALHLNGKVGLDIENADRRLPEHLAERILHPDEFDLLDDFPLIRLWTIKEAVLKLMGLGLYAGMPNVSVHPMGKDRFSVEFRRTRFRVFSVLNQEAWIAVGLVEEAGI